METTSTATPGGAAPSASGHRPVLLHHLIQSLQPQPGETFVDGTLGGGGVVAVLAEHLLPGGRIIAIDRDPQAVAHGAARFASFGGAISVEHGDFADLHDILARHRLGGVDGVVLDLGISSDQLDDPRRGFSFRTDGPLDMRMDPTDEGVTAAEILNRWPEGDLVRIIRAHGQERFAGRIARAIARQRDQRPFTATTDLRECVERTIPRRLWPKRIHPATRTFQALRIEVNHELESLERGLQAAIRSLRPGGRLGVIAFHSLEDTLVKNALHVAAQNCICPPQQPICTCAHRASLLLSTRRGFKADGDEVATNPRARSARLRVATRI